MTCGFEGEIYMAKDGARDRSGPVGLQLNEGERAVLGSVEEVVRGGSNARGIGETVRQLRSNEGRVKSVARNCNWDRFQRGRCKEQGHSNNDSRVAIVRHRG